MKYESVNNDENIAHYFKNLLIDKQNDYMLKFELFYIKMEQFYSFFG